MSGTFGDMNSEMLTEVCSVYQEFLTRSLTDKYSALSSQMDKVIHDANAEISSNREKITRLSTTKVWLC